MKPTLVLSLKSERERNGRTSDCDPLHCDEPTNMYPQPHAIPHRLHWASQRFAVHENREGET